MLENSQTPSGSHYKVLAIRTRPQSFAELVGQEAIANSLAEMVATKRIPHAFLFTGTRGTGKTSSARILAKSLCCEKGPTTSPCQTCMHCLQITSSAHTDVIEIDGASNTGVDNIRELRDAVMFFPNSARYKIFIIDEVHMLSTSAFNALLKTLEEPPPQVIFILATTELHKIPNTVRSRCMIFSFRKVPQNILVEHLKNILTTENIESTEEALELIAREAKGSIRDSLSILEQVMSGCAGKTITLELAKQILNVGSKELANNLLLNIAQKNVTECIKILNEAEGYCLDLSVLLEETAKQAKNAVILKEISDAKQAKLLTQLLTEEYDKIKIATTNISNSALGEIFKTLMLGAKEVTRSSAGLAWAEIAVIDCIFKTEWLNIEEILKLNTTSSNSIITPTIAVNTNSANKNFNPFEKTTILAEQGINKLPEQVTDENINNFYKVINVLLKTKDRLANKLKRATVVCFNSRTIEFKPDNFTDLTEEDASLFLQALNDCGYQDAEIIGIGNLQKKSATSRNYSPSASTPSPKSSFSNNDGGFLGQFSERPSKDATSGFPTEIEEKKNSLVEGVSLINLEREKKTQEYHSKVNKLKQTPHIKKLLELSDEIEFIELDE